MSFAELAVKVLNKFERARLVQCSHGNPHGTPHEHPEILFRMEGESSRYDTCSSSHSLQLVCYVRQSGVSDNDVRGGETCPAQSSIQLL